MVANPNGIRFPWESSSYTFPLMPVWVGFCALSVMPKHTIRSKVRTILVHESFFFLPIDIMISNILLGCKGRAKDKANPYLKVGILLGMDSDNHNHF